MSESQRQSPSACFGALLYPEQHPRGDKRADPPSITPNARAAPQRPQGAGHYEKCGPVSRSAEARVSSKTAAFHAKQWSPERQSFL